MLFYLALYYTIDILYRYLLYVPFYWSVDDICRDAMRTCTDRLPCTPGWQRSAGTTLLATTPTKVYLLLDQSKCRVIRASPEIAIQTIYSARFTKHPEITHKTTCNLCGLSVWFTDVYTCEGYTIREHISFDICSRTCMLVYLYQLPVFGSIFHHKANNEIRQVTHQKGWLKVQ